MKKSILYVVLAVFVLLVVDKNSVIAQINNKISVDQSGTLLRVKSTDLENVVGTPYLLANWVNGNVKFQDANPISNVALKLDLLENLLIVKGQNEVENLFDSKVVEFSLQDGAKDRLFRNGFTDQKNKLIPTYFEILYDGKTKFISREVKMIIESTGYNTGTITKNIDSSLEYYIAKANNTVILIKLNEKSILTILNKPDLVKYINDNKLNLKNISDITKALQYYDTL